MILIVNVVITINVMKIFQHHRWINIMHANVNINFKILIININQYFILYLFNIVKSCQDLEYHCQDSKAKCLMLDGQNPNDIEQILQAKLTFDSSIIFNNNGDQQSPMPFCLCSNGYLLNKLNSSCDGNQLFDQIHKSKSNQIFLINRSLSKTM